MANAGTVRFYKTTEYEGDKRIRVSDEDQPGCHTLRWRGAKIYRVAVINYQYCTVHTEKECTAESIIPAIWRGSEYRRADIDSAAPQEKLLHGTEWILGEENIKAKSWRCVE